MTSDRRVVRATSSFFDDLDRQLGDERGLNGEPSATDFQVHDLFEIVERFATDFDNLPEAFAGRTDYRVLVTTGVLVRAVSVMGQLMSDEAIELLMIDLDLRWE